MNFERYIASRLRSSAGRFSKPIVIIGIAGVVLSVSIILLSFAIVRGFTEGITDKAVGFNAHIQVSDLNGIRGKEAGTITKNQGIYDSLNSMEGVKHVQTYVNKQSIIETEEGISGVFVKGFAKDFYWDFFKKNLIEGEIIAWDDSTTSNETIISKTIADKLDIHVGDKLTFYFIRGQDDFSPRKLTVAGLYNTDMIEFDERFVLMDIRHLQKINDWGLEVQVRTDATCENDKLKIEVFPYGGDGIYHITWSDGKAIDQRVRYVCPNQMNNLSVVLSDDSKT
ncbi:MAG: lipoprotein-releasing system permease protein, partial [Urechidicola sp.]